MPKKPNKPMKTQKKPKPKKPKREKPPKETSYARMGAVMLALLAVSMALPVAAEEAHFYPYGAVAIDRLSELEEWSTGVTIGGEVTKAPVFLLIHLDLHDVLTSGEDKYPWDTTVGGAIGLYKTVEIAGIAVTPSGSFTLKRPSGVDLFPVGFNAGLEAAFDNLYTSVSIDWHDILTRDESEVYPWDQTVRLAVGGYLGDSPEDDREEEPD